MEKRRSELKAGAKLTLFLVSYLPLFIIMCFSQVYQYKEHLFWGGLNRASFVNFVQYFGAVSFLLFLSIFGIIGLAFLFPNMKRRATSNGAPAKIIDIENKNNESISYLFTYLIPFVFQDLSNLTNVFAISILLFVTYVIYTNSSMLLINPTISIRYSIYMIEYEEIPSKKKKKGMIISSNRFLEEDDEIKLKSIGHKLFYAVDAREASNANK